ncbi:MAG: FmdB family zinc ribbon protein [Longimicrobiales bacterium]
MPTYEYHCESCGETFDRTEHLSEHQDAHPRCPHCDSDNVRQVMSAFYAKTAKKS